MSFTIPRTQTNQGIMQLINIVTTNPGNRFVVMNEKKYTDAGEMRTVLTFDMYVEQSQMMKEYINICADSSPMDLYKITPRRFQKISNLRYEDDIETVIKTLITLHSDNSTLSFTITNNQFVDLTLTAVSTKQELQKRTPLNVVALFDQMVAEQVEKLNNQS